MKTDDSELTGLEAVKAKAEQWRRKILLQIDKPWNLTSESLAQMLTAAQMCDRFASLCEKELERNQTVTLHQIHSYATYLARLRQKYILKSRENAADTLINRAKAEALEEAFDFLGYAFTGSTAGIKKENLDDSE